jgi:hypothetical protein
MDSEVETSAKGRFTALADPVVDKHIQRDLKVIQSALLDMLGMHMCSLVLVGGFGRGEGSVRWVDDKLRVVNDYDLLIIVDKMLTKVRYRDSLAQVAKHLARSLDLRALDLGIIPIQSLSTLPCTIYNYELREGHKVLYGDVDLKSHMPCYNPRDIPLFEGARLLFNRGGGLLLSMVQCSTLDWDEQLVWNFAIEHQKALLAMGDCILLLTGQYHYSYSERLSRISLVDWSLVPGEIDLSAQYRDALRKKLVPNFQGYMDCDLRDAWFDLQTQYEAFYRMFEGRRLSVSIESWKDYFHLQSHRAALVNLSTSVINFIKLVESFGLHRGIIAWQGTRDWDRFLMRLLPLLLFSIRQRCVDVELLAATWEWLGVTSADVKGWLNQVSRFLTIWHP